jgi:D-alanine-D-alanine ligase
MRITVLAGGPSSEREISLISGRAVADGLRKAGHDVFVGDISPTDLSALDVPADVIFPVLHGNFGESGELQLILEQRNLKFVGSGSHASHVGMNKIATKKIWRDNNLPTPAWRVMEKPIESINDLPWLAHDAANHFTDTLVVKAIQSGSSIDVFVCTSIDKATAASKDLLTRHTSYMAEQFVAGTELTVGLLDDVALPPIRIETSRVFFDFEAKYKGLGSHDFNTHLPDDIISHCQTLAVNASRVLGCRHMGRVDLIVDADHQPWLLEINTIPGFTPVSLLPEAAAKAGVPFAELVDRLALLAVDRLNS